MQNIKNLISLRDYCRQNKWPRLPQWQGWITSKKPIAVECIKKIGGRYMVDLDKFQKHIENATLED
jgi:hypothetical protein